MNGKLISNRLSHWKPMLTALLLFIFFQLYANPLFSAGGYAHTPTSTREEAIAYIDSLHFPEPSDYWPNIKPEGFMNNIKLNVNDRFSMYPGIGTYFCGYGAFSYLLLQDDPLGYVKFMTELYRNGKARLGSQLIVPSTIIRKTAGTLKYKGLLDIRPAEQMLYLSLADHFKGYLNIFNRRYDAGDENRFWASVNYAKFNRMLRKTLHYEVQARGSDLKQPAVGNVFEYICNEMKKGTVALYLNNRILHKKKHERIKLGLPTHYVILENISRTEDHITLVFWDYGGKTLLQVKPAFLHKIIFGITVCIKNDTPEN